MTQLPLFPPPPTMWQRLMADDPVLTIRIPRRMTINAKPESVATLVLGGYTCLIPFLERYGAHLTNAYQVIFPAGYLDNKLGPFLIGVAMYMLVKRAQPAAERPAAPTDAIGFPHPPTSDQ